MVKFDCSMLLVVHDLTEETVLRQQTGRLTLVALAS